MHKRTVVRVSLIAGCLILLAAVLAYSGLLVSAQENRIRYGDTTSGTLETAGERQKWTFDGLRGDNVLVHIERTEGDLVLSAEIGDPEGTPLIALDWPDDTQTAMEFAVSLPRGGAYTLTIRGLGNSTGSYLVGLELVNPGAEGKGVIAYGRSVTGTITEETFRQPWAFRGVPGDVIDATMTATSGDLEPYLSLLSPDGDVLATADTGGADGGAALLAVRLPASGTYTLVARRAGENSGQAGVTAGDYALTLTLRSAGDDASRIAPAQLAVGTEIRGRLNANTPVALYRLEAPGILALALDLLDPYQAVTVTVMTRDQALIGVYSGVGLLRATLPLAEPGEIWLEVTAPGSEADAAIDFSLRTDGITAAGSRSLLYGTPQAASVVHAELETWYFAGQQGDLVEIALAPYAPVLDGDFRVRAPDGTVLIERVIQNDLRQPLILKQSGLYQVVVGPVSGGYQIRIDLHGTAGRAFEQRALPGVGGVLAAGGAVSGSLAAGESTAWLVSIGEPQVWEFTLSESATLAVESPAGETLAVALTDEITRTATVQIELPYAGRYRAVVFDPTGAAIVDYTLQGRPVSGGDLRLGEPAKGMLSARRQGDTWRVLLPPDAMLNLKIRDLGDSGLPAVHVIGPDSLLVASTLRSEPQNTPGLLGIPTKDGGIFEIAVTRAPGTEEVIYEITAESSAPFAPAAQPILVSDSDAFEVFTADPVPTPQMRRIVISNQLSPSAGVNAEILADAELTRLEDLVRGEITGGRRYQAWSFAAATNQMLAFSAVGLDGETPGISLFDAAGQVLAERFKTGTESNTLVHRFTAAGVYTVVITLMHSTHYMLWIDPLAQIHEDVPDVVRGQAMTYGDTVQAEIGLPGDSRVFAFYGHAGDTLFAQIVRTKGQTRLDLALADQYGGVLQRARGSDSDPATRLTDYLLPANGVYQIIVTRVDDGSALYGRLALHLNLETGPSSAEGGILEEEVVASLGFRDTVHRWLLSVQAGESLTVRLEPIRANGPDSLTLELADSVGNVFLRHEARLGQGALHLQDVRVPRSGIYQVIVSGGERQAGFYRLTLDRAAVGLSSVDRALEYGQTVGQLLTRENFLDVWTFAGSQGDVITLAARTVLGDSAAISIQLRTREGQALATAARDSTSAGTRIENVTLPASGHYAVIVGNPDSAFEGEAAYELTVSLINTPARSMGSVIGYGQQGEGNLYLDDPVDTWMFEGQQGDTVSITAEGLAPFIRLLSTDWHTANLSGQAEVLASAQALPGEAAHIEFVLPLSAPYAVAVEDPTFAGGTYRLEVLSGSVTQVLNPIRPDQPQTGQIGLAGLTERWGFTGVQGSTLAVTVSPDSRAMFAPAVDLLDASGRVLAHEEALLGEEARLEGYLLPATGDYVIAVTRALEQTGTTEGRYELMLQLVAPEQADPPALDYGTRQLDLLDDEDPFSRWMLNGQPGDVVHLTTEVTGGDLDPVVRLVTGEGNVIAESDDAADLNAELFAILPPVGPYFVEVLRFQGISGSTGGNYAIMADLAYRWGETTPAQTLHYGDRIAGTLDNESPVGDWDFVGEAGDAITARLQFAQDDSPLILTLLDPAGGALAVGQRNRGDAVIDGFTLPIHGAYTLRVQRPGDARADFSPYALELRLSGTERTSPSQGGLLVQNRPTVGQFLAAPATHAWVVTGSAGQPVILLLTRLSGSFSVQMSLIAPDGRPLFSAAADVSGAISTGNLTLPLDGTYLLLIAGDHTAIGAMYRLEWQTDGAFYDPPAVLTSLQDGFGIITALQVQNHWYFDAAAGDVVSLRVGVTTGDLEPTLVLWSSDLWPLAEGVPEPGRQASLTNFFVPSTGTYEVAVGREGGVEGRTAGSYRVMLRREQISSQAAAASDLAFDVANSGFMATSETRAYAFQALAGDVIGLAVRSTGGPVPGISMETEAGVRMEVPITVTSEEVAIPAFVLPADGRYIVMLHGGGDPSSYDLLVFRREREAPAESTIRNLGRSQVLIDAVRDAAQPVYWRLTANSGEVLNFVIDTTLGGLQADVALFGPRGYVASAVEQPDTPVVTLGPVRMPDDGEYYLRVAPWLGRYGGTSGAYSIQIARVEEEVSGSSGGHIPAAGLVVTGGLTPGDGEDVWTFDAQAGESVVVRAEPLPGQPVPTLEITGPAGSGIAALEGVSGEISLPYVPETGRYTVRVFGSPTEDSAIEYRLGVVQVRDRLAGRIGSAQGIDYGEQHSGEVTAVHPVQAWVFFGRVGERVTAEVTPAEGTVAPVLYLVAPNGQTLHARSTAIPGSSVELDGTVLLQDGFYGLIAAHMPGVSGGDVAFTIRLDRLAPGALLQGTLEGLRDEGTGQLTDAAPVHQWTLEAAFSGEYLIRVASLVPGEQPQLIVNNAVGEPNSIPEAVAYLQAGQPGTAVVSGRPVVIQGNYTITMQPANRITGGGSLSVGRANVGHIDDEYFTDEWTVEGTAGSVLTIEVTRVAGDLMPFVSVFDQLGGQLLQQAAGSDGLLTLTFEVPSDGIYRVLVSRVGTGGGPSAGDYTIVVQ